MGIRARPVLALALGVNSCAAVLRPAGSPLYAAALSTPSAKAAYKVGKCAAVDRPPYVQELVGGVLSAAA
jgi:hypothetical protein